MDFQKEFELQGGQKKLTEYPLSLDSVVFDIGGYLGDWTAEIIQRGKIVCEHCGAKQDPYVYVFEPVKEFYDFCCNRFKDNPKVSVFPFGLSNFERLESFSIRGSASCSDTGGKTLVVFKDIATFCYENNIKKIDLMSINIEGGEYALLDRIIQTGLIQSCQNLQVQFHGGEHESSNLEREKLVEWLLLTHDVKWSYPFVWESFTKRS